MAAAARKLRGFGCALGVGVAALAGCRDDAAHPSGPVPVTEHEVAVAPAQDARRYSANVQPYTQVELQFQVSGTIDRIAERPGVDGAPRPLQSGDRIALGQELAALQADTYRDDVAQAQQQLVAAQASFRKASEDFERSQRLHAKQFVSDSDFDGARESYSSARAQVGQSQAALAKARTELGYATLRAPLEGVVLQRNVVVGDLVGAGTVAFEVADEGRMKVEFAVPASLALRLEIGHPLGIAAAALPGTSFEGKVSRVDAAADTATRDFDVEVTVANPDGLLRSGMVATLSVPEGRRDLSSVLVPLGSVVRPPGASEGFAVALLEGKDGDRSVKFQRVELGDVYGDRIAVLEGVAAGDRVVVRGATLVREGQPVRVIR